MICAQPEDGLHSQNMLLMITYRDIVSSLNLHLLYLHTTGMLCLKITQYLFSVYSIISPHTHPYFKCILYTVIKVSVYEMSRYPTQHNLKNVFPDTF
jgi:hypothetical protein